MRASVFDDMAMSGNPIDAFPFPVSAGKGDKIGTLRAYFPETWIWTDVVAR